MTAQIILLVAIAVICLVLLIVSISILNKSKKGNQDSEIIRRLEESDRNTREEISRNREETAKQLESMNTLIRELQNQNNQSNEKITEKLAESIQKLQQSNEQKLDQMRATVDEKLTSTLKERLTSSFEIVNKQLESVHKSLGEMKEISGSVSDLQKVLSNVKTRGVWGEVQLGNLLSQTLSPTQYEQNVSIKKNGELVEYAVKIPSKDDDNKFIWLPIDSKFPQEDYIRIMDCAEAADKAGVEAAVKALETNIKGEAKKIADKYIKVPDTTNFAIMFLPTEGLYSEVMQRAALVDEVQNKYHIMICGPTTIVAFLNTLSMGFKTIAINKKASEVWKILSAAKQRYEKFGELIEKVRKNISSAEKTLDEMSRHNSTIKRGLNKVVDVSEEEADGLLNYSSEDTTFPEEVQNND